MLRENYVITLVVDVLAQTDTKLSPAVILNSSVDMCHTNRDTLHITL